MAKNCNPITISTCPPESECTSCKEIIDIKCVKNNGDTLLEIINEINTDITNIEGSISTIEENITEINSSLDTIDQYISNTIPQACVKFKYKEICIEKGWGSPCPTKMHFDEAFSCSSTILPEGCVKSYKVFDWYGVEAYSFDTIDEFNTYFENPSNWESLGGDIKINYGYELVEYITCINGTSESQSACFESVVKDTSPSPMVVQAVPRTLSSCKCCPDSVPE
jgi:hypothetical protein